MSASGWIDRLRAGLSRWQSWTRWAIVATFIVVLVLWVIGIALPESPIATLVNIDVMGRALRLSTPITLAALGGLFAEKSGVFNIGLEGFLIFGAFTAVAAASVLSGGATGSDVSQLDLWLALVIAVVVTALLAAIFAVFTIKFKADQIVAGLAVWFMGLGFAPFMAILLWEQVNSPRLDRIDGITIGGETISPFVPIMLAIVVLAWVGLFYTRYGYWIRAAGENPEALDTAGISVNRVRYGAVILSGVLCGIGGAALSIGFSSGFVGRDVTMVNGRGWIAITAYLFGNYNPIGTFGASLLFGGVDAIQVQLQTIGVAIPGSLTELFPYVAVLVVLVIVGKTRMPSSVGEPYDPTEE